jgi:hypothetical protein
MPKSVSQFLRKLTKPVRQLVGRFGLAPARLALWERELIMNNALAILIGAVIIAAAILIVFRWQVVPDVYLLDRWTGTVTGCLSVPGHSKLDCEPR